MAKNEYLNFAQICTLFPGGEKPINKIDRRNIYKTENGEIVYFKNSKDFDGSGIYWYSFHIIDMYNRGVNKVSFTVAHNGIIILPILLLLEYAPHTDYNEKQSYHYIRIKCLENRYYLYNSNINDIDITTYFIQKTKQE